MGKGLASSSIFVRSNIKFRSMRSRWLLVLLLLSGVFTACFDGDVVELNYRSTLEASFLIPDSVKTDTVYVLQATPAENPLAILLDSFSVSPSTIQRVQIDTILVTIEAPNLSTVQLSRFDSLRLVSLEGTEVLVAADGSLKNAASDGFDAAEGVSLHQPLLDSALLFQLYAFPADFVADSVRLQFTMELTISGKAN